MMPHEIRSGSTLISDDKTLLQTEVVYDFLSHSYWATAIPKAVVEKSIEASLCFGVYHTEASGTPEERQTQVGFARVITDCATFAYLCDLFIIEAHRGKGLSKQLMSAVLSHPDLQGLRRFLLMTRDAHSLYTQYGFQPLSKPQNAMEINRRDLYISQS